MQKGLVADQGKPCPNCEEVMDYNPPTKKGGKDCFWKCPDCGTEVWPPDLSVEKQIRRIMFIESGRGKARKRMGGKSAGKKRKKPAKAFNRLYRFE